MDVPTICLWSREDGEDDAADHPLDTGDSVVVDQETDEILHVEEDDVLQGRQLPGQVADDPHVGEHRRALLGGRPDLDRGTAGILVDREEFDLAVPLAIHGVDHEIKAVIAQVSGFVDVGSRHGRMHAANHLAADAHLDVNRPLRVGQVGNPSSKPAFVEVVEITEETACRIRRRVRLPHGAFAPGSPPGLVLPHPEFYQKSLLAS